ncbi:hypothetical protein [Lyngbya confervoides]|uniref:Uncharacterized protein n=1 Tax=Lyngbya confervoides BDU141951 TaxID=1574623 RepID=A0ABD4T6B5_9CYAN|nr:hypothetical protein [Lyngbya confervoides]MCM1984011.1 hypothetical protein [Lyngbya confervoides BDU141951]
MKYPITDGYSDCWQTAFIRDHFLSLGHGAWQGYLTQGRGMVACEVMDAIPLGWSRDQSLIQYIPAAAVPRYLQPYRLPDSLIHRLMDALQTYSPRQDILISVRKDQQIEVDWLQNLAIDPPDCHRQVCNRWDEFHLDPLSILRTELGGDETDI